VKGTLTDGSRQVSGGAESGHNDETLAPVLKCIEPVSLINENFQASDRRAASSSTVVALACTATTSHAICGSERRREPDTVGKFFYNLTRTYSASRAPIRTSIVFRMDSEYEKNTRLLVRFRTNRSILR